MIPILAGLEMVGMDRMYRLWILMQLYILYIYIYIFYVYTTYIHLYTLTKFRYTMMVRKHV